MDKRIDTIQSSVIDGIAATPRYRERQLAQLHKALLAARTKVIGLLTSESLLSQGEATAQFLLTAKAIKTFHTSVHPKKCLDEEYLVAQGKDHTARRSPYGYAYIVPSQYDLLYSTVVPVAAAVAAGNCVVLEIQQTTSDLGIAIKQLMLDALSAQSFAVVAKQCFNESIQEKHCIHLDGRQSEGAVTTTKQIRTNAGRIAAVIDRSADIKTAARECIKARFGFGGRSAYAPDVVLVNKFSVQAFCTAATETGLQYLSASANGGLESDSTSPLKRSPGLSLDLQKKLRNASADILVSGGKGTVAVLKKRGGDLLGGKLDSPLLLVVPISSMDDAIDYLGQEGQSLQAIYLFCAPAAAKYLGQFISSSITTVNHIPNELLIGGPAPSGHGTSVQPRYTVDMFSIPRPEIVEASAISKTLSILMSRDVGIKERRMAEESMDISLERVKEAYGPPIGFFEQGVLVGLSCILVTAVTIGVLSVRYGGPVLMSRLKIW